MTTTDTTLYAQIKAYERAEFEGLGNYLAALDPAGWTEQSYCTDWRIFQVVSHIGSGSKIGGMRLRAWVNGGPPVTREVMQGIWGHFDALAPEQMLSSYRDAVDEYLATEAATPDEAGVQEVEGFAGRRPLAAYQVSRVWELACHSWDVYVSRDRTARLHPAAVAILAANLHQMFVPIDKDRAKALTTTPVAFKLTDSGATYTLDPNAERPRVQPAPDVANATDGTAAILMEAPLVIEGPDEEVVRFISGRHFVPGSQTQLKTTTGTAEDLAKLRRAFR